MQPEHWQRVKEVFHSALSLPEEERAAFLDSACTGDNAFRRDVESLLGSYKSGFLEDNVWPDTIGENVNAPVFEAGRNIGHYRIVRLLGRGGMGDVYEAHDTKLNRSVALKFLSVELKDDALARRRLHKEAQAVARLEHRNICPVYGTEQVGDDYFIVMQYIDGEPVDRALQAVEISAEGFAFYAAQIIDGVAFAHEHGIIHRDLKPGNIMLARDGTVKVLDFGLAKTVEQGPNAGIPLESVHLSGEGLIAGTIAYMSPEQLRGELLDYRSDIFSLGAVFYELLTKHPLFQRRTKAETISAVLNDAPVLTGRFDDSGISCVIKRCLEKNRDDRFQSISELAEEIAAVARFVPRAGKQPRQRRAKAAVLLLILAACTALAVGAYSLNVLNFLKTVNSEQPQTLAVLPVVFEQTQPDKDFIAEDLTQGIIRKLSSLAGMKVTNALYMPRFKKADVDARDAGVQLGVQAVFAATISSGVGGLKLKTRLVRTADGALLDSSESVINEERLVGLTETVATRVATSVRPDLTQDEIAKLTRRETESEQAKSLYIAGRLQLKQRRDGAAVAKAIEAFTAAKDIDQNYAAAWAGLALAYLYQTNAGSRDSIAPAVAIDLARKAAGRAVELDPLSSEPHSALGLISVRYDWDWSRAEAHYRRAIEIDPEYAPGYSGLINVLQIQGRYDEAISEVDKIGKFDPLSVNSDLQAVNIYYRKRDFGRVDEILLRLSAQYPEDVRIKGARAYQLLALEKFVDAVSILEPMYASEVPEVRVLAAAPLGYAYARSNRGDEALSVLDGIKRLQKGSYVSAQEEALVHLGLGDMDRVFMNLRSSCAERYAALPGWVTDPITDAAKADPRFEEIRNCVNL